MLCKNVLVSAAILSAMVVGPVLSIDSSSSSDSPSSVQTNAGNVAGRDEFKLKIEEKERFRRPCHRERGCFEFADPYFRRDDGRWREEEVIEIEGRRGHHHHRYDPRRHHHHRFDRFEERYPYDGYYY